MNYYKSEFHEKLVRSDAEANQAFAKPITGGLEMALPAGSPILVDALSTPISKEEYDAATLTPGPDVLPTPAGQDLPV